MALHRAACCMPSSPGPQLCQCSDMHAPPLVPLPQVGEVWVRGPTVFSGYFGLPQATAEAFAEGGWFK